MPAIAGMEDIMKTIISAVISLSVVLAMLFLSGCADGVQNN